jgi:hypothetical protein
MNYFKATTVTGSFDRGSPCHRANQERGIRSPHRYRCEAPLKYKLGADMPRAAAATTSSTMATDPARYRSIQVIPVWRAVALCRAIRG